MMLVLALALWIPGLASAGHVGPTSQGKVPGKPFVYLQNQIDKLKAQCADAPIWQITQDETADSVNWVDHTPNPRFAIYDAGIPKDATGDLVFDKETGLIWERCPGLASGMAWPDACVYCYNKALGNRKGWRLATVEELTSLIDPNAESSPALPKGHPFSIGSGSAPYVWSATTLPSEGSEALILDLDTGDVKEQDKTGDGHGEWAWCVRGGIGHDAY